MDPNPIQPVQSPPTFPSIPPTSTPPLDSKPDKGVPVLVLIPILIIIVASIFFLPPLLQKYSPSTQQPITDNQELSVSSVTPSPTPTPISLKPDEGVKGNYTVSKNAKDTGPTFSKVTFDPLDVQQGQNLTITVTLSSQSSVSSVTGMLTGDTTSMPMIVQKISQTAATSVWSTTFSVTDTLLYTYMLKLEAVNTTGTSSVTVAPR